MILRFNVSGAQFGRLSERNITGRIRGQGYQLINWQFFSQAIFVFQRGFAGHLFENAMESSFRVEPLIHRLYPAAV